MRMKYFRVSLLFCLAVLAASRPGLTDFPTSIPSSLLEHLQKQGWTQVSPGVMQRSLGGNRVETLGFGAAGLRFQIEELKEHLVDLRKDYAEHPSRQLRIAIRAQRAQILRVEKALRKARETEGLELSTEALIAQGPDCSVDYDASAFAFPLVQSASATARAYFNNACGYVGEAYAHSKSKATNTDNAVTLQTKSDPALDTPQIGANVSASASTNANGVRDCDSYAYASITNYDLEIIYAQSDRNFECVETLPSPWSKTDVGAVGPAGGASHLGGVFKLIAGGNNLAGTADAFHFVHQTLSGDGEIVANVAALLKPAGANFSLAGVTVRNDLTAGSMHATMMITTEGAAQFRRRTTAGGTTLSAGPGAGTTFAPQWLKLVRSGNVFTAYLSADGVSWTQVHTPQTVPLSTTAYVGLVALRNGATAPSGAARFEGVAVRFSPSLPTLSISDASVVEGGELQFTVTKTGSGPATVNWGLLDGSAVEGTDYVSGGGSVINFASADTSKTFAVATRLDSIAEPSETMTAFLSNPSGAVIARGNGTGTIIDASQPGNSPPTAVNDTVTVETCSTTYISAIANDTDPEGDRVYVAGASGGNLGTASWGSYTLVRYIAGSVTGSDVVTYTVEDYWGARATGTIYVSITAGGTCP